jgi:hypothetical protein
MSTLLTFINIYKFNHRFLASTVQIYKQTKTNKTTQIHQICLKHIDQLLKLRVQVLVHVHNVKSTLITKSDYLTTHTSLSPIWRGFAPGFVNYKKGWTQLAAASDKVYQLLAHGRWFSPGTPLPPLKTGRHDIKTH